MKSHDEVDDPRRRLLIQALSGGLLAGTMLDAFAQVQLFSPQPGKLPPGQSVYRLSGTVTVGGAPATLKTRIIAGDTVETSGDGEIVFVVGGNAMILRGSSKLEMSTRNPGSFLIDGLRLLTGALLSVSRNRHMRVVTPTATIGIRGTGFYLEADPAETYFCTCYGTTEVVANNDPASRDKVTSAHHDHPLVILSGEQSGRNIRNAGFRNHTDQELTLIESLVGRRPPFAVGSGKYNPANQKY